MNDGPWYRNGLKFRCTQCGDCCTGAPGYVWVNRDEMEQLAQAVGSEDVESFRSQYARRVGVRYSLNEFPNGDCVFFDGTTRRCTVYEARPRQCRSWPFWDSNLKTPEAWAQTCEVCPGSGKGHLYQIDEIEARRGVMKI